MMWRKLLCAGAAIALSASVAVAGTGYIPNAPTLIWRPYLNNHSLAFYRSPVSLRGLYYGVPDNVTVGGSGALAYERTQPWTAMAAIRLNPLIGNSTGIIFTNVTNAPNYPGYELIVDASGHLRVRLINTIGSNYIDV